MLLCCCRLRLMGLPDSISFDDLLGMKGAVVKKGAMKPVPAGAGGLPAHHGASLVGEARKLITHHLGDGQALVLEMQVRLYCLWGSEKHFAFSLGRALQCWSGAG